jgi:hypothetical protein
MRKLSKQWMHSLLIAMVYDGASVSPSVQWWDEEFSLSHWSCKRCPLPTTSRWRLRKKVLVLIYCYGTKCWNTSWGCSGPTVQQLSTTTHKRFFRARCSRREGEGGTSQRPEGLWVTRSLGGRCVRHEGRFPLLRSADLK